MGMTFSEEWTVLQNILARTGNLAEVDLSAELAKAHSMLNNMDAQTQMQNMAKMTASQPLQGTISPDGMSSMPEQQMPSEMPQNGAEMNMPPMM